MLWQACTSCGASLADHSLTILSSLSLAFRFAFSLPRNDYCATCISRGFAVDLASTCMLILIMIARSFRHLLQTAHRVQTLSSRFLQGSHSPSFSTEPNGFEHDLPLPDDSRPEKSGRFARLMTHLFTKQETKDSICISNIEHRTISKSQWTAEKTQLSETLKTCKSLEITD